MWKKIVLLALVVLGATGGFFVYRVKSAPAPKAESGTYVAAPPVTIIAEITRLQNWVAWSREKDDPTIRRTYGGPSGGPGASYYWFNANRSVDGRMTVISVNGDTVEIEREIIAPNPRLTDYTFKVTPEGPGSRIVWSASGDEDDELIGKAFGAAQEREKRLAGEIQSGLKKLKNVVEAQTNMEAYRVERETTILAPDVFVLAEIMDFREWAKWLPREQLDPEMKRTFTGTDSQPGATYYWSGGDRVGSGRISMISSSAEEVELEVELKKPIDSTSDLDFTLFPAGAGIRVVWTVTGQKNSSGKALTLLGSTPETIGDEMDEGLANLKLMAEASVPHAPQARSKTSVVTKKPVLQILDDSIVLHASH